MDSLNQLKSRTFQELFKLKTSDFKYDWETAELKIADFQEDISPESEANLNKTIKIAIGTKYIYIGRQDITDPEHTHTKIQVARIELDTNGDPINFLMDADQNLVKETLSKLGSLDFFREIKVKFKIQDADEVSLRVSEELSKKMNDQAETKQREVDEIRTLSARNDLLKERDILNLDVDSNEQILSVEQGELAIIGSEAQKRYLETIGAGPCIVITVYDRESKKAGMTHIDGLTDEIEAIRNIIKLAGNSEVRVFGGDESSIQVLINIKKQFDSMGVDVVEWDILNDVKSIVLDRKDGQIYNITDAKDRNGMAGYMTLLRLYSSEGKSSPKILKF